MTLIIELIQAIIYESNNSKGQKASVLVNGIIKGQISSGVLIFLGVISDDNNEDISWLCNKIANLRIFDDKSGVMNISLKDYTRGFSHQSIYSLCPDKKG